jgi:hypothetical protein
MSFIIFGLNYLKWHYSRGFSNLIAIVKNIFLFIFDFFSIHLLVMTLFSPWRRLGEVYIPKSGPTAWLETVFINTMMRLVGLVFRLILLAVGSVSCLAIVLVGTIALLLWLIWPFMIFVLFLNGLALILK